GLSCAGVLAGHAGRRAGGAIGLAVKIEDGDGARRAGSVAVCAALAQLGVLAEPALVQMGELAAPLVVDPRGMVSGEVRATFSLP
ncbi:MAG: asparaginase, partial [Candidatus Limnocylindria bacterium]